MKTLIAAVGMSLLAGAAFAGEGAGNPFPFTAPPLSVSMQGYKQAPAASQNPFPFAAPGIAMRSDPVLPTNGSEGVVQTANSAPPGSEYGVANMNLQSATPVQLAQPTVPLSRTHG